jgi:hypothetical protein
VGWNVEHDALVRQASIHIILLLTGATPVVCSPKPSRSIPPSFPRLGRICIYLIYPRAIAPQIPDEHPPRSAQTRNMAPSRTRKDDSDGPSTAEVSANEDVEMQDQVDRVNGFKKFGVSGTGPPRDRPGESHDAQ